MFKLYTIDEHGMREPNRVLILVLALMTTILLCAVLGYPLFLAEAGVGNIDSYSTAAWNVWTIITTIGFGDHYPVTLAGRLLTIPMYIMSLINFAVVFECFTAVIGRVFPTVAVREIRSIVSEILRILQQFDTKTQDNHLEHNLDQILDQSVYHGPRGLGLVTRGLESSGIHCVSVDVKKDGHYYNRWHLCTDEQQAIELQRTILEEQ